MARVWLCILVLVMCGCSRRVAPHVVAETHTTLNSDSITRLITRMIGQNSMQRERERIYVFQNREVTLNENGDIVKERTEHITDRSYELERKVERLERENDSLRQVKNKIYSVDRPVPYPVEVVKTVERKRVWWESALMWIGGVGLAAGAVLIAARLRR